MAWSRVYKEGSQGSDDKANEGHNDEGIQRSFKLTHQIAKRFLRDEQVFEWNFKMLQKPAESKNIQGVTL